MIKIISSISTNWIFLSFFYNHPAWLPPSIFFLAFYRYHVFRYWLYQIIIFDHNIQFMDIWAAAPFTRFGILKYKAGILKNKVGGLALQTTLPKHTLFKQILNQCRISIIEEDTGLGSLLCLLCLFIFFSFIINYNFIFFNNKIILNDFTKAKTIRVS